MLSFEFILTLSSLCDNIFMLLFVAPTATTAHSRYLSFHGFLKTGGKLEARNSRRRSQEYRSVVKLREERTGKPTQKFAAYHLPERLCSGES